MFSNPTDKYIYMQMISRLKSNNISLFQCSGTEYIPIIIQKLEFDKNILIFLHMQNVMLKKENKTYGIKSGRWRILS